jgi:4-alpha-glucanotransferase
MAGNPLLLSLDTLAQEGWIGRDELDRSPYLPPGNVEFGSVIQFKVALLKMAARTFFRDASDDQRRELDEFCAQRETWLPRFAEFMALKDANGGVAWTEWEKKSNPDPSDVRAHNFIQFQFFRQWGALKAYCNRRGIRIIGDIPIFVAHDSADVWANPEIFDLQTVGLPRTVAGVPPDYFSTTGQLWGNPLFRWDVLAETGYRWWIDRVRATLELVDLARLDHFRGFEKYYEVPGGSTTAIDGRWVDGPGDALFAALEKALGKLPFIAEDLGYITHEVHALRDRWGFPGMRVLQFAFGSRAPDDPFKPHNFIRNCVVYTGTHDNDTTAGWFTSPGTGGSTRSETQARAERELALRYLNSDGSEIHWDFIRAAIASVAGMAVIPLQDVLGLGSEARMNVPASAENNWRWRFLQDQLRPEIGARLLDLTGLYGRLPSDSQ